MFGFLKRDPLKHLLQDYEHKLQEALDASHNGDKLTNTLRTQEAEAILVDIQRIDHR